MGSKRLDCLDCDACQIDQLKHGIDSCQTQIDALNRSMGELVGRLGSFDTRLDKLEAAFRAGLKPSVVAAQDVPTPELLQTLRANGVTRYQDGELVIELGRAAAPRPALVSEPPNAAVRYRIAAEALWGLLDDIDTADDVAKGDDALYRGQVRALAAGRLDHARSFDGGDHLTWSWQKDDPASCWHDVHQLKCTACGESAPFHAISCPELPLPTEAQRRLADAQQRLDSGEDVTLQDDAPPGAPEPIESPSGFGIDHEALQEKLEQRAKAMGRAPE